MVKRSKRLKNLLKKSIKINTKASRLDRGIRRPLTRKEKLKYFKLKSKNEILNERALRNEKSPLPRGNIFVEKDRRTLKSKTSRGHYVIALQASHKFEYWYWGTTSKEAGWKEAHTTSQLLLSHPKLDNWNENQIRRYATAIFRRYYAGHSRNNFVEAPLNNIKVEIYNNRTINQLKWKSVPYASKLLNDLTLIKVKLRKDFCFFDAICELVNGKDGFINKTKFDIENEFKKLNININNGLSFDDFDNWISNYGTRISYYVLLTNGKIIHKRLAKKELHRKRLNLVFMVQDDHIQPVINDWSGDDLKNLINILNMKNHKELQYYYSYFPRMDYNNYHYISIEEFLQNEKLIINGKYKINKIEMKDREILETQALVFESHNNMEKWFENNNKSKTIDYNINTIGIASESIKNTNYIIDNINFKYKSFRHQVSGQYYLFADNFKDCEEICNLLSKTEKYGGQLNFKFNNQTPGSIANNIKLIAFDNIEEWKSSFHPELRDKIDKYSNKPLTQGYTNNYSILYDEISMEDKKLNDIIDDELYFNNKYGLKEYDDYGKLQYLKTGKELKLELTEEKEMENIIHYKPRWKTIDHRNCYPLSIFNHLKNVRIPIFTSSDNETEFIIENDTIAYTKDNLSYYLLILPFGYYFCERFITKFGVLYPSGYYPHIWLNHLLINQDLDINKIKSKILSLKYLNGSELCDLMDEIFKILPIKYAKIIANAMTGTFGKKYITKDTAYVSKQLPFLISLINYYNENELEKDIELNLKSFEDRNFLRIIEKTRINNTTEMIYYYIYGASYISFYEMMKKTWKDNYLLVGVKTDSYQVVPLEKLENENEINNFYNENEFKQPEFDNNNIITLKEINKYKYKLEYNKNIPQMKEKLYDDLEVLLNEETEIPSEYDNTLIKKKWKKIKLKTEKEIELELKEEINNINNNELSKNDIIKIKNEIIIADKIDKLIKLKRALILGGPGCGKTYLLARLFGVLQDLFKDTKKVVVMVAKYGSVVDNFQEQCYKLGINNSKCYTFDSLCGNKLINGKMKKKSNYIHKPKDIGAIIIDEITQFTYNDNHILMYNFLQSNKELLLFKGGDDDQNPAIADVIYKVSQTQSIKYLSNYNILLAKYLTDYNRFKSESKMLELIKYLKSNRKFPDWCIDKTFENNNFNNTELFITAFRDDKKFKINGELIKFLGCNSINKIKSNIKNEILFKKTNGITIGDRVVVNKTFICEENGIKLSAGAFNTALDINNGKVLLKIFNNNELIKEWFPIKSKNKNLINLALAETTNRLQGITAPYPITIINILKMKFEAVYTAISRVTTEDDLFFFNVLLLKNHYFQSVFDNQLPIRKQGKWDNIKKGRHPTKSPEIYESIIYIIKDINNDDIYIGQTKLLKNKSIQECLDTRLINHRNKNHSDYRKPVADMINPIITQLYPIQSFAYGTREIIEELEQIEIRNAIRKFGDNVKNQDIRNMPVSYDGNDDIDITEEYSNYKQLIEKQLNKINIRNKSKTGYPFIKNKSLARAIGNFNKQGEIERSNIFKLQIAIDEAVLRTTFGSDWNKDENIEKYNNVKTEMRKNNKYKY